MRGGCRITCRPGVDLRKKSSNLLSRRGCTAAVDFLRPGSPETEVVVPAALTIIGGGSGHACRFAVEARRHSSYLLPRCPDAAVVACLLKTTGGGCRLTCRLAVDARRLSPSRRPGCSETNSSHLPPCRVFGAAVVLPAASPLRSLEATVAYLLPRPWMRGGIRETCLRGNNRRPLSSHLRPGCRCRLTRRLPWMHGGYRQTCRLAVDARRLSPYLRLGCRSHLTCYLAVDTRRLSHFLRRSSPETKVVLPAASLCMRGGCRQTCRHDLEFIGGGSRLLAALPWMQGGGRLTCCSTAWMPQSTYLPPRRRCEAAVALPATLKPGCRSRFTCCLDLEITEGRSGPTCCLVMYARRLSSYLLLCCLNAAVVLLAALPWMRGGDRLACDLVDRRAK